MARKLVTVITPVFNEARHLRPLVAGMQAQDVDGDVEFLLLDGGSTDGTRDLLKEIAAEDPRIRVMENPRKRQTFALNIGLREAKGEYIARMDAHTVYPPNYLRSGIERLQRDDDTVSVSGPQLAVGTGAGWSDRIALALQQPLGVGGASFRTCPDVEEFPVDTGFSGVWRTDTLLKAGGWDETWGADEDCELAFRLSAAGGTHVCLPAMAAEYRPRESLSTLGRQYWHYGKDKVKTFHRHDGSMRPSHLLPPGLAVTAIGALAPAKPVRRAAGLGLGVYFAALATTAVQTGIAGHCPRQVMSLPIIHATMHMSYGVGVLFGVRRHGVPVKAIAKATRRVM